MAYTNEDREVLRRAFQLIKRAPLSVYHVPTLENEGVSPHFKDVEIMAQSCLSILRAVLVGIGGGDPGPSTEPD